MGRNEVCGGNTDVTGGWRGRHRAPDDAVAGQDALDVALRATLGALSMQAVYVGTLTDATFTFSRVLGDWPGLRTGMQMPRSDSLCGRMLAGASPVVADLSRDSAYSDSPVHLALGVQSYVGVPLQRFAPEGPSTLCGIHPVPMQPSAEAVRLTYALADALSALLVPDRPVAWCCAAARMAGRSMLASERGCRPVPASPR